MLIRNNPVEVAATMCRSFRDCPSEKYCDINTSVCSPCWELCEPKRFPDLRECKNLCEGYLKMITTTQANEVVPTNEGIHPEESSDQSNSNSIVMYVAIPFAALLVIFMAVMFVALLVWRYRKRNKSTSKKELKEGNQSKAVQNHYTTSPGIKSPDLKSRTEKSKPDNINDEESKIDSTSNQHMNLNMNNEIIPMNENKDKLYVQVHNNSESLKSLQSTSSSSESTEAVKKEYKSNKKGRKKHHPQSTTACQTEKDESVSLLTNENNNQTDETKCKIAGSENEYTQLIPERTNVQNAPEGKNDTSTVDMDTQCELLKSSGSDKQEVSDDNNSMGRGISDQNNNDSRKYVGEGLIELNLMESPPPMLRENTYDVPKVNLAANAYLNIADDQSYDKQRRKHIYEQLRKTPWIEGYYSEGKSIQVFVDLDTNTREWALQQICDITGQLPNRFQIKHSTDIN